MNGDGNLKLPAGVKRVHMECLHSADLVSPPHIGEMIWCVRCHEYKTVVKAPPYYTAKCRDCRKLRTDYGVAKVTAETRIAKHREKNPTHTVDLYDGSLVVRTFRKWSDTQPPLFGSVPF